jgi:transposase
MHECFRWTNGMVVSINWEAFSRAFRSQYQFRVFTFKLCFGQLPTGKTLHRRSPRSDPKCPACSHASKCNDHMFQCKAISRRQWKSSFIQSTRKRAEDCKTDPKLVHILLAGIRSYFDSCSPPHSKFTDYPPVYRQLAINQTTIGWGHLIRGRIISSWETIQQDYIYRTHPSTKFEPDAWHRKLLHPMLIDCHILWTIRNGE